MGLLEKAQQKKQYANQESPNKKKKGTSPSESLLSTEQSSHQKPDNTTTIDTTLSTISFESDQTSETPVKNKKFRSKRKKSHVSKDTEDGLSWGDSHAIIYLSFKRKKIIEEKTGFGYKGIGTRRIVFDYDTKEYVYEVSEPFLTQYERNVKKELAHLFKMLADVNITDLEDEEKKRYLEETLEQIIIDNDIKFYRKIKPKKAKKGFFSFGGKKDKNTAVKKKQVKKSHPQKTQAKKTAVQTKHLLSGKKDSRSTKHQSDSDAPSHKQTLLNSTPEKGEAPQEKSPSDTQTMLSIKEEQ
jgi:hypothetical protein